MALAAASVRGESRVIEVVDPVGAAMTGAESHVRQVRAPDLVAALRRAAALLHAVDHEHPRGPWRSADPEPTGPSEDLDTRPYAMPWGLARGAHLVGFLVLEQVVHGWDLCQALGRRAEFDAEAVAIADGVARAMDSDAMRSPGMFGPEVIPQGTATPLEKLVAFLGRRP